MKKLPGHRFSLSCVTTKSTSFPLKWLKVRITLSGGTTGWSLIINSSKRDLERTWFSSDREGLVMKLCGLKCQKKVARG